MPKSEYADQALQAAIAASQMPGFTVRSSGQFDAIFDHVLVLLHDAAALYARHSYGTALFLAVTAIEETAKCEIGSFRNDAAGPPLPRKKDPLYRHDQKHQLAVQFSVFMGTRLIEALGQDRCAYLQQAAVQGAFVALREAALYVQPSGLDMETPCGVITQEQAREMLLLAIETADDRLVGFTSHTMNRSDELDALFKQVRSGHGVTPPTQDDARG